MEVFVQVQVTFINEYMSLLRNPPDCSTKKYFRNSSNILTGDTPHFYTKLITNNNLLNITNNNLLNITNNNLLNITNNNLLNITNNNLLNIRDNTEKVDPRCFIEWLF